MISKLALIFVAVAGFARAATVEEQVKAVLDKQAAAWNRGDTDAFLEGYASDTIFVGDRITRGVEDLRKRYQARYPTRAAMGKLTFYNLEIHAMDKDHAYVIGNWKLERDADAGGDVSGVYSLVFRRTAVGWKIVLDHTN